MTYLNDDEAELIGGILAEDFDLSRSKDNPDRWQTLNGSFTNKGIARRAMRLIEENRVLPRWTDQFGHFSI
jgi:hypothetical protein